MSIYWKIILRRIIFKCYTFRLLLFILKMDFTLLNYAQGKWVNLAANHDTVSNVTQLSFEIAEHE